MSLQMVSNVINLYLAVLFLYIVIPLITYLVSPVQNASLKKNDPRSFFFFPGPPWEEALRVQRGRGLLGLEGRVGR
jgi:hypothetical protein